MGATSFITYTEGAEVETAFRAAVEQACYDFGHSGGTGTIAEKDTYTVIDGPRSADDAEALAKKLIWDDDNRIADKWGPAGAIAVRGGTRTLTCLPVPARAEGYPDQQTAAQAAAEQHLSDGEIITSSYLHHHLSRSRGGVRVTADTTATVITTGSPAVTGWLFFGMASD